MQERHTEQDYRALLIADTPIIDVRAPIEFEHGAMPAAINLPLMNNDERAAVGTCYKQQGSDAALALGHKLVAGEIRQQRMDARRAACLQNPQGILCCARGGQRSHIVQSWLHAAGLIIRWWKAVIRHCARPRFRRLLNWHKTDSADWRLYRQR